MWWKSNNTSAKSAESSGNATASSSAIPRFLAPDVLAKITSLELLARHDDRAGFSGAQGHYLSRPGKVDVELEYVDGDVGTIRVVGDAALVFETSLSL